MADKALLLGINEYKSVSGLKGCLNDVENVRNLLIGPFGFDSKNVNVLTNDRVQKSAVQKQMTWLFQAARPGDRVVLHYSGHGSFTADLDGDEDDGADEMLCLYDMDFNDPGSYLLDDEIRKWTEKKPEGVQLTVIFDSCHSGTGTRFLIAPDAAGAKREVLVDPHVMMSRALKSKPGSRGLDAVRTAANVLDPDHEDVVRVRFLDPPPAIKAAVARRRGSRRGFVKVDLNHFLLAACRDDQTAADAVIDGTPNGAFTFNLCKASRDLGAQADRRQLIAQVEAGLRQGQFDQVPQFEGSSDQGPLFGESGRVPVPAPSPPEPIVDPTPPPGAATDTSTAASPDSGAFHELITSLKDLTPDVQRRVLDIYEKQFLAGPSRQLAGRAARAVAARVLVYVHGICTHRAGFSEDWWKSLRPFTNAFGEGVLGQGRREVVWSDVVNARALAARGPRDDDAAALAAQIREALNDRLDRQVSEAAPTGVAADSARGLEIPRGLSIPGLNCIDDFAVYMTNDSVRAQILQRFTSVVRPLIEQGTELDIISHSWGTVVTYEGLRELADLNGLTSPSVRDWFTVGAALSLGPVKLSLRSENKDGARPAMVRRWVNLAAKGDVIGGALRGRPYAVDNDFVNLEPFSCASIFGIVNPACAHGSYFIQGNVAVNRDIFADFINLT